MRVIPNKITEENIIEEFLELHKDEIGNFDKDDGTPCSTPDEFRQVIVGEDEGMTVLMPVILFKHVGTQGETNSEQGKREVMLGCAPDYKLYELLDIKKKDGVEFPRSYRDYDAVFHLSKLPRGVKVDFNLGRSRIFSGIILKMTG